MVAWEFGTQPMKHPFGPYALQLTREEYRVICRSDTHIIARNRWGHLVVVEVVGLIWDEFAAIVAEARALNDWSKSYRPC